MGKFYLNKLVTDNEFFTIKNVPAGNNVSDRRWTGFFIASKPKHPLPVIVDRIFTRYWEKEDVLIDYFFIDYAIDLAYKYNTEVKEQIDNIEINNPDIYNLLPFLPDKFDIRKFSKLTENTSIFKLSWKKYKSSDLQGRDSLYRHLKKQFFND